MGNIFNPQPVKWNPVPRQPNPTPKPYPHYPFQVLKSSIRNRRSIVNENFALPLEIESKLPTSFHEIDLTYEVPTNTTEVVNSLTGMFLVIQLMISSHPRARPYLHEICSSTYPTEYLEVQLYIILLT